MIRQPKSSDEIAQVKSRRKSHHSKLHEGEGESWAVSYSDLLMVLMSFFIIFYNTDQSTGKGEVESLVKKLNLAGITLDKESFKDANSKVAGESEYLIPGFPHSKSNKKRKTHRSISSTPELEGMKITQLKPNQILPKGKWNQLLKNADEKKYKGGILIDLSDNIYSMGGFDITKETKRSLDALFDILKQHQDNINMVFIGHTDSIPVKDKRAVVDNNIILSHMRAAKAVEYAISSGFDPMWVSSQGLSEYTRNTRSLSIRIMER